MFFANNRRLQRSNFAVNDGFHFPRMPRSLPACERDTRLHSTPSHFISRRKASASALLYRMGRRGGGRATGGGGGPTFAPSPFALPPITHMGLSAEVIDEIEHAPPPQKHTAKLAPSASAPELMSERELAFEVSLGLSQMRKQMEREAKQARAFERALSGRPLQQSLSRSSKSFASLRTTMKTKLEPLKKQHLQRGERAFLMRSTTQKSRELAEMVAGDPKDALVTAAKCELHPPRACI